MTATNQYIAMYGGQDRVTEALQDLDAPSEARAEWDAWIDSFWRADIHPAMLLPADEPEHVYWSPDLTGEQEAQIADYWREYQAWAEYLEQLAAHREQEQEEAPPAQPGGDGGLGVAPWPGAGTTLRLALWGAGAIFFAWSLSQMGGRKS